MRQIAISDIHGCARTFRKLLQRLELSPDDELYLLGDYIDRGPDSKGVLDTIFELVDTRKTVVCLRGNHEQLLMNVLEDHEKSQRAFMISGGAKTLDSFGVDSAHDIPEPYLDFLFNLPFYQEIPGWFLTHAGLHFGEGDPLQHTHHMLWIRNWYKDADLDWLAGRKVVHGHTPLAREYILAQSAKLEESPFLDIDNGCVYGMEGGNHLCAFDLGNRLLHFERNCD